MLKVIYNPYMAIISFKWKKEKSDNWNDIDEFSDYVSGVEPKWNNIDRLLENCLKGYAMGCNLITFEGTEDHFNELKKSPNKWNIKYEEERKMLNLHAFVEKIAGVIGDFNVNDGIDKDEYYKKMRKFIRYEPGEMKYIKESLDAMLITHATNVSKKNDETRAGLMSDEISFEKISSLMESFEANLSQMIHDIENKIVEDKCAISKIREDMLNDPKITEIRAVCEDATDSGKIINELKILINNFTPKKSTNSNEIAKELLDKFDTDTQKLVDKIKSNIVSNIKSTNKKNIKLIMPI